MIAFEIEIAGCREEFRFAACAEAKERGWRTDGSAGNAAAGNAVSAGSVTEDSIAFAVCERPCLLQRVRGTLSGERLGDVIFALRTIMEEYVAEELDGAMHFMHHFMPWERWEDILAYRLSKGKLEAKILEKDIRYGKPEMQAGTIVIDNGDGTFDLANQL